MKNSLKTPFPDYAYTPALITIILHFTAYLGTQLFNRTMPHQDLSLAIDAAIPVKPEWILVYVITFIIWICGLAVAMRQDKETCYSLFGQVLIADVLCIITFLVFPTIMPRPEIAVTDYPSRFLALTYAIDQPTNLFPSMHCLLAWMCFRCCFQCKNLSKIYIAWTGIMSVLVCISTLLVKQHVVLDVVSAIIYAEFSICLGKRLEAQRFYHWLERHMLGKIKI